MARKTVAAKGSAGAATAPKPRSRSRKKQNSQAVNEEQISARAFQIYQDRARSGQPGSADGDWAAAEAELRASAGDT